ncbi:hypothetical protein MMC16_007413 [Acarospora aff. strigata]|nr:hypothetical protein [Acarospora aff. strigata]
MIAERSSSGGDVDVVPNSIGGVMGQGRIRKRNDPSDDRILRLYQVANLAKVAAKSATAGSVRRNGEALQHPQEVEYHV